MSHIVLDPESWEAVEAGAEACVEQWLAAEGDHVHAGQVLGRARLLHALVDIPTPHEGDAAGPRSRAVDRRSIPRRGDTLRVPHQLARWPDAVGRLPLLPRAAPEGTQRGPPPPSGCQDKGTLS